MSTDRMPALEAALPLNDAVSGRLKTLPVELVTLNYGDFLLRVELKCSATLAGTTERFTVILPCIHNPVFL